MEKEKEDNLYSRLDTLHGILDKFHIPCPSIPTSIKWE